MSIMTEHTCSAWAIYINIVNFSRLQTGISQGALQGGFEGGEAALWWHKEDKEVTKWSASALRCHMKNITENRALSQKKKNTFLPAIQKFRMGNLLMSGWDQRLDHSQLLYWTLSALERWSSEHCRDRINLIIIITMAIIIVITITIMAIIIIVAISFQ